MKCPHCGKSTDLTGNPYQDARIRAKLTLTEAARKTGVAYTTLWNYESGDREPTIPIARKMAAAYDCTLDELCGATKSK